MQNNPLMHHSIIMLLMKALRAALNVQRVQQCVRFRARIQTIQVQNNQVQICLLYTSLLGAVKEFKSIIDADLYFFGSVYYILIEGKIIDTSRKDELISDINSFIENLKADDNYTKSPNDLSKLRNRIEKSISLYKGYVK